MRVIRQQMDDILDSLRPLTVEWRDDVGNKVIDLLSRIPRKDVYSEADILEMLNEEHFEESLLIARLFLGLSKDSFESVLRQELGSKGCGITRLRKDPSGFVAGLVNLGLLDAMASEATRELLWTDTIVERLRSGRGSAISGQKRGRSVEDFAEAVLSKIFDGKFEARVSFSGREGKTAKCDFAVPNRTDPCILIEAKGYGATG